jgi:16S rRNA (guanine(1405)-N(7))-methyltransferase
MSETESVEALVTAVCAHPKYAAIDRGLVRRLVEKELGKGRSPKETLKVVRTRLHQVGSAYQEKLIDYAQWLNRLASLPRDLSHPQVHAFCLEMMAVHASTQERLPYIQRFYRELLSGLDPIRSLSDLACGLNPLSLPWLPLAKGAALYACDIYTDLTAFLHAFFSHFGLNARAETCDLIHAAPPQPVQLALLLKTIPCLEQIDKTVGRRLLETVQADVLLVSFPVYSLGGRSKGMLQYYETHFRTLVKDLPWRITRFEFPSELVFRLERG